MSLSLSLSLSLSPECSAPNSLSKTFPEEKKIFSGSLCQLAEFPLSFLSHSYSPSHIYFSPPLSSPFFLSPFNIKTFFSFHSLLFSFFLLFFFLEIILNAHGDYCLFIAIMQIGISYKSLSLAIFRYLSLSFFFPLFLFLSASLIGILATPKINKMVDKIYSLHLLYSDNFGLISV
ncbi:unnamed protein product [Acanthosepion pharaonis]|uniref:Uncharacterized protein n=1 Tax=Acanthosepion pharaonis TaxID=158019 RepID=A0A812BCX4_ACAPH|nr:unnamed protein product [Sepia pharaonis]